PAMAINPNTGVITATPSTLGIYVFAVRVEEFKNGVKIGEIRREVQYQVIACGGNAPPTFSQPIAGNYKSYTIIAGDSLCFPITLNDPDTNDSITITANGDLLNNPKLNGTSFTSVKGHKNGTTELCFTSSCESIADAPYKVQFIGKDFSCYGSNTVTLDVDVFVKSKMEGKINPVPNVFSPNSDSKNDYFQLNAIADFCANPFSIQIFDRWGLKVYESNELDFRWDGKYMKNGKDLTQGVYYYIISANFSQSSFEEHGFVQLLR
ncbi:MAG: gliding motility-associated C-terminal domain-containing protein, partial [Bacteroidetes bacterium]|nr:gliding motility-associated C-terminal domain-containing protein [Bacteroidota bacterium]